MNEEQIIQNWLLKAEKDVETAKDLYKAKHYDWCLFIWHLAVEKVLKAKIVSLRKELPYTHKLIYLAEIAELVIGETLRDQLREITSYNIEARYDDYKLSFYYKATKKYTNRWMKICEKIYLSIRQSI